MIYNICKGAQPHWYPGKGKLKSQLEISTYLPYWPKKKKS